MEAISSELDIFSKEVFQAKVVSEPIQEFGPIATIQETGPIEFLISCDDQNYVDLNSSKFEVDVKLTKPDGSDIPGTVKLSVSFATLILSPVAMSLPSGLVSFTRSSNLLLLRST